jgi:hypothetical protein
MYKAVVLINTEMGADEEVFETLKSLPEVKAALINGELLRGVGIWCFYRSIVSGL